MANPKAEAESEKTAKTSAVRIRASIHARATELAESMNYSLAQFTELCIEDCISAIDSGKPVTPRVAKIARALKEK